MAYVNPDYTSKKSFIEAVRNGVGHRTYNPSGMFETVQWGNDVVEGPHCPKPHKWYASVKVEKGIVVSAR